MKDLIAAIKSQPRRNILVIGDIMLDEYIFGEASRISPEAPVPIILKERNEWNFGGAANTAANCHHIGFNVHLVGIVNENDTYGKKLYSMLHKNRISSTGIVASSTRPTTCKSRVMANSHQLIRIDTESTKQLTSAEQDMIIQRCNTLLTPNTVIMVSDYAKGVINQTIIEHLRTYARENNCTMIVDPKGPDFFKYYGTDYLKPNKKEFEQLVTLLHLNKAASLEENSRAIIKALALQGLVVTMGSKGIAFTDKHQHFIIPGRKREVFNLSGAGDTVFAFFSLAFSHNIGIKNALEMANNAASIAISHLKTYAVSLDELTQSTMESCDKIFHDWTLLKIELDWLASDGKKIVFTNGCFDLLHSGHLHTLKEARKMGDILVVAINTDASIKRLKGADRPVKDLNERMAMLAAIGYVDFVVAFDQDTPLELITYIKPDILVKGGDYKQESIVGYDLITAYGGQVLTVDYKQGLSTTSLINTIKQTAENV